MDGDLILGALMILFWIFSSLVARFGRKVRPPATSEVKPPPEVQRGARLQDALRELAEQMGVEKEVEPAEKPVASEHTVTIGEHSQTALETQATLSEHREASSEHRQVASETRRTPSEERLDPSEHVWSSGEHVRGDLRRGRSVPAATVGRLAKPAFARRLHADLIGDKGALARAMVLKEILGPPVSLRSSEQDRF